MRVAKKNDEFAKCVNERYLPDDVTEKNDEVIESQNNELIWLAQPPVIYERLKTLKEKWNQRAIDAEYMVCTEETLKSVKGFRSEMRKEFEDVETLRKQIKKSVMEPYEQFEFVYRECVSSAFKRADQACAGKISEIEKTIKKRCEESLREYFEELCVAHHVEWLKFESSGIKIDMTSAKQKTHKKLREQLVCFVVKVAMDVDTISGMEYADELLAEYKLTLDMSNTIATVTERHRRIEAERQALDTRQEERDAEIEAERRIEALAPPVQVKQEPDENEIIPRCTFTAINATHGQLQKLKAFLNEEGIEYE